MAAVVQTSAHAAPRCVAPGPPVRPATMLSLPPGAAPVLLSPLGRQLGRLVPNALQERSGWEH